MYLSFPATIKGRHYISYHVILIKPVFDVLAFGIALLLSMNPGYPLGWRSIIYPQVRVHPCISYLLLLDLNKINRRYLFCSNPMVMHPTLKGVLYNSSQFGIMLQV